MLDEHVQFLESARIEEEVNPLARGEFARVVLLPDAFLAAAGFYPLFPTGQFFQFIFHFNFASILPNRHHHHHTTTPVFQPDYAEYLVLPPSNHPHIFLHPRKMLE